MTDPLHTEPVDLLACPFCGGEPSIKDYGRGRAGVRCVNPDCRAHGLLSLPGEDPIAAWNSRDCQQSHAELLEALENAPIIWTTESAEAFRARQYAWLRDVSTPAIARAKGEAA